MLALTSIGQDYDSFCFFLLNAVAHRCHVCRIVIIPAIRLLNDHGEWSPFARDKPIEEDALSSIGNGDQPFALELFNHCSEIRVIKRFSALICFYIEKRINFLE